MADEENRAPPRPAGRFLGSLRDALAAAAKEETRPGGGSGAAEAKPSSTLAGPPQPLSLPAPALASAAGSPPDAKREEVRSAAEAARAARGGMPNIPPLDKHVEFDAPPTTRVVKGPVSSPPPQRTQRVRGKQTVKRGQFHQDPVVGWFVIVGGPGLGAFRPIFEGNNTLGRSSDQRIPIDFGDEAISAEEQCYIRYDAADRSFLFVPNLAKTNVVSLNDKRPTAAVPLVAMDVITMGRTQLVFVPFCGSEFDWSELPDLKD